MTPPLSQSLRDATRDLHEQVEQHSFNQDLFSGTLSRTRYARYLSGMHAIADAMERTLKARQSDPRVAGLLLPDLFRSQALTADQAHFPTVTAPVPELATRMADPESLPVEELAAMVYVRYMADLGGGQLIGRRLAEAWDLSAEPDNGLSLYRYPKPVAELRHALRAALDALPLNPEERDHAITAACDAFRLHETWFDQL